MVEVSGGYRADLSKDIQQRRAVRPAGHGNQDRLTAQSFAVEEVLHRVWQA